MEKQRRGRPKSLRLEPTLLRRVETRRTELGLTLSGYIKVLIADDLAGRGRADILADVMAQVSITTGIMVRRLVDHVYGEDATQIEMAAAERAAKIIEQTTKK